MSENNNKYIKTYATQDYVDDNKDFIHLTGTTENPIVLTALELGRYLVNGPVKFHPGLNAVNVQNKDNYQITIGMKTASAIRGTVMVNGLLGRFHYNYNTQEWFRSDFMTRAEVLTLTNYEEYTPTQDYHPATKKYVDDKLSNLQIVQMTQTEYDSLTTKDPNTLYLII